MTITNITTQAHLKIHNVLASACASTRETNGTEEEALLLPEVYWKGNIYSIRSKMIPCMLRFICVCICKVRNSLLIQWRKVNKVNFRLSYSFAILLRWFTLRWAVDKNYDFEKNWSLVNERDNVYTINFRLTNPKLNSKRIMYISLEKSSSTQSQCLFWFCETFDDKFITQKPFSTRIFPLPCF